MQGEMVSQITERLEKLPGDKLSVVYDVTGAKDGTCVWR